MSDYKQLAIELIEKSTQHLIKSFNHHLVRMRTESVSESSLRYSGGFASAIEQFVSLLEIARKQIENNQEIDFTPPEDRVQEDVPSVNISASVSEGA